MFTLLVLAFNDEVGAQEMSANIQLLQRQQKISLSDAAIVIWTQDGKVKVKQANKLVGAGSFGGAFWGLLIGQLFWYPRLNQERQDNYLPTTPNVTDYGLEEYFVQQVNSTIHPGSSALFLIIASGAVENLPTQPDNTILQTRLDSQNETKLREAFGVV
jgi:uncharacterized membrane protein